MEDPLLMTAIARDNGKEHPTSTPILWDLGNRGKAPELRSRSQGGIRNP
jgi:hypothetical protein